MVELISVRVSSICLNHIKGTFVLLCYLVAIYRRAQKFKKNSTSPENIAKYDKYYYNIMNSAVFS